MSIDGDQDAELLNRIYFGDEVLVPRAMLNAWIDLALLIAQMIDPDKPIIGHASRSATDLVASIGAVRDQSVRRSG